MDVGRDRRTYLVESLIELRKLGDLRHHVLAHHVGGLDEFVLSLAQEGEGIRNKGLVEGSARASQVVTTMTNDASSALGIVASNHVQQLVVRAQAIARALFSPSLDDNVVFLHSQARKGDRLEGQ